MWIDLKARAGPPHSPPAEPAARPPAARLVVGAVIGALAWVGCSLLVAHLPIWVRFLFALLAFTLGIGSLVAGALVADRPVTEQIIVLCGLGVGFAPTVADVLGRAGALSVFPYVALAGAGMFAARVPQSPRETNWRTPMAALLSVAVAVVTGAIAFGHRLLVDANGITIFGDYDSVDLSYYAAITAELTHRIPPMAPFYSGHALNYSWYPHLLLALVHRFASVPVPEMYFRYAWPAFLAITAATGFVFVRTVASTGIALFATVLVLVGGDFSYVFVWLLRPATYLFDWLLWPTNFLAPTMEVLHFSTWTPSLPVLFSGLYALARADDDKRRTAWIVMAAASFALLVQFKPFAFAVLMTALGAAAACTRDRSARWHFSATCGLSVLLAVPFLYQVATLYAESRGHLKISYFLLQWTMLDKLALAERVHAAASRLVATGPWHTAIVLVFATALFFIGGLGMRWTGVPAVFRAIRPSSSERSIWRLLAWIVIAGVAIPFIVVTEPYHDTLQFYQTALFVLWLFAARAVVRLNAPRAAVAGAIALALAAAIPSSVHYLAEKAGDGPNHSLVHLSRSELAVADYLRSLDPERTVVLHDRPLDPSLFVIVGERRTVLAWSRYVTGSEVRQREVDRFFASADREPVVALDVLQRYNVTHVIERPGRDRINRVVLSRLRPVLTYPDVVLYEVPTAQ